MTVTNPIETVTVDQVPVDGTHEIRWGRNFAGSPYEPWRLVVGEQLDLLDLDDRFRTFVFADRSSVRLSVDHGVQCQPASREVRAESEVIR